MMDLLVQIVTAHHLQLSGHIIQALEMAPAAGMSDKILPYKPNTPIGALDTQHVKVVPKHRNMPVPRNVPSGHQPFESTFRLKVHLPRNQLYVTRVSQNVYLEDIMSKVCKEKNLDSMKYEFRHPGNLDEVLDPKLTLSDYQITEIYVVTRGSGRLTQAFSTSDIMALRKEEERKQFQAKTGGGVFNLIFKRGKTNPTTTTTTGSVSSDTRSISPVHSDDSRSVTPPVAQTPVIKEPPPPEKPKPPQRKRRPAPKPPQIVEERRPSEEKPASQISDRSQNSQDSSSKRAENGLTICHSRNSSDSSGYHEASVLSENCNNASLPRRPKTMMLPEDRNDCSKLSGEHSRSTGNLSKMSSHSKSTSSLAFQSRKKKAAPRPPPPVLKTEFSKIETASPSVVASQNVEMQKVPTVLTRSRSDNVPIPAPRRFKHTAANIIRAKSMSELKRPTRLSNEIIVNEILFEALKDEKIDNSLPNEPDHKFLEVESSNLLDLEAVEKHDPTEEPKLAQSVPTESSSYESPIRSPSAVKDDDSYLSSDSYSQHKFGSMDSLRSDVSLGSVNSKGSRPEIVGVILKKRKTAAFDTLSRKRGFQIGTSLVSLENEDSEAVSLASGASDAERNDYQSLSSKMSDAESSQMNDCEMNDFNEEFFKKSVSKKTGRKYKERRVNELLGIHNLDEDLLGKEKKGMAKNQSASSLRSMDSLPGFMGVGNMKKWNNSQDLDDISMISNNSLRGTNRWVVGDFSDSESISTAPNNNTPPESPIMQSFNSSSTSARTSVSNLQTQQLEQAPPVAEETQPTINEIEFTAIDEPDNKEVEVSLVASDNKNEADSGICENTSSENTRKDDELEPDWQYQLPSPPRGFRDASPVSMTNPSNFDTATAVDSVVTSPELFEKLNQVKTSQEDSDVPSVLSEEDKEICNKLTLEHLEKRKSLVYNRELATSLKYAHDEEPRKDDTSIKKSTVLNELENVIVNQPVATLLRNPTKSKESFNKNDKNLPNFKISTYDGKKEKINIFEDDTVRSNADVKRNSLSIDNAESRGDNDEEPLSRKSSKESVHGHEKDAFHKSNENIFVPRDSQDNKPKHGGGNEDNFTMGKDGYDATFTTRKLSKEDVFKRPQELSRYRLKNSFYEKNKNVNAISTNCGIGRSESFSNKEAWSPSVPVKRSKSQVALNKYKDENLVKTIGGSSENLSRSGVLFDVSGLQSLEVIRMIQTKLSHSNEQVDSSTHAESPKPLETTKAQKPIELSTPVTKTYHNHGPPSINLCTWSQRPKSQVTLKEDTDYKHNIINTRHMSFNEQRDAQNTTRTFSNKVKINGSACEAQNQNSVSIKVNGSEPITQQKSGNVIIKIGGADDKSTNDVSTRFINHVTPDGYRKPLGNINKIERQPRPHSVAFDSQFDISRVPIVRSVELKKPFKDLQASKSVTQIYSKSSDTKSLNYDSGLRAETKNNQINLSNDSINKLRSNVPVVKGFRTETAMNPKTWNLYGTLPAKSTNQSDLTTNKNVPFSQLNLRRTNSIKTTSDGIGAASTFGNVVLRNNSNSFKSLDGRTIPPPPPVNNFALSDSTKFARKSRTSESNCDPRDELLSAIRNFGGKSSLRTTKR